MGSVRRRLFNALSLLSLVLAITVAALWVRSVWWRADLFARNIGASAALHVSFGPTGTKLIYSSPPPFPSPRGWTRIDGPVASDRFWLPGVHVTSDPVSRHAWVEVPYWFALLCLIGLPAWSVARRLRPPVHPTCPRCGYDLHATAGPACPECGGATPLASGG